MAWIDLHRGNSVAILVLDNILAARSLRKRYRQSSPRARRPSECSFSDGVKALHEFRAPVKHRCRHWTSYLQTRSIFAQGTAGWEVPLGLGLRQTQGSVGASTEVAPGFRHTQGSVA